MKNKIAFEAPKPFSFYLKGLSLFVGHLVLPLQNLSQPSSLSLHFWQPHLFYHSPGKKKSASSNILTKRTTRQLKSSPIYLRIHSVIKSELLKDLSKFIIHTIY